MSIQELEAEALKLGPEDQARLLHKLALALHGQEAPDLTNDELEKRWAEFQASVDSGVDSAELRARATYRYSTV
jgi:hypothetical protein